MTKGPSAPTLSENGKRKEPWVEGVSTAPGCTVDLRIAFSPLVSA